MKTSFLVKCVLIAASLPLLAGCVERQVVYRDHPAPPPPPPGVVVTEDEAPPPPPPQVEIITAAPGPLSLWFWAPGCYEWRGGRWAWVRGHWITRPHPGAVWIGAHWDVRNHHRVWVTGNWR